MLSPVDDLIDVLTVFLLVVLVGSLIDVVIVFPLVTPTDYVLVDFSLTIFLVATLDVFNDFLLIDATLSEVAHLSQ